MMQKNIFFCSILVIVSLNIFYAQIPEKKPLDHSVYNDWKNLESFSVSDDGNYIFYQIDPQVGDGLLYLYNVSTGKTDSVPRGCELTFSPGSEFAVFKIKPENEKVRKLKIDKAKKEKFPKDSVGIFLFDKDSLIKYPDIKSFYIPKDESDWCVLLYEKTEAKPESEAPSKKKLSKKEKKAEELKKKVKEKEKKQTGTRLEIFNPVTDEKFIYKNISECAVSRNGKIISFISVVKDSIDTSYVFSFDTQTRKTDTVYTKNGLAKKITSDYKGQNLAFIHSEDTCKTKTFSLFYYQIDNKKLTKVVDTLTESIPRNWTVCEHGNIFFSENAGSLFLGTALKPEKEIKDSIPEDEKYRLDIWHYQDQYLQTKQNKDLTKDKNKSYTAVYHINQNRIIQLGDTIIQDIVLQQKGNGRHAIGINSLPYAYMTQWLLPSFRDYYLIDIETGDKKLIRRKTQSPVYLSPAERYLYWFDIDLKKWFTNPLNSEDTFAISDQVPYNFYNEEHDMPEKPGPYGVAGWTEDDRHVLIYDRYDIWKFDPLNNEKPKSVSSGMGRKQEVKFIYIDLDPETNYIKHDEEILLSAFDEKTKDNGFYACSVNEDAEPEKLIMGAFRYRNPVKAKNSDLLIWTRSNFYEYPVLQYSDIHFRNIVRFKDVNPQQNNYLWGNVSLIEWKTTEGDTNQGILYKPENFDPQKKYPMIVYFYEKYSDQLHAHYPPVPSRSIINFPYYTSNGYIIFIPDIHYQIGRPGQDAYNSVISGTDYLISLGFVDENKIGLQGQSWGGYQVAYLITQTNKFRAAMAGAPVSNMTSGYGGIRGESGISRQFQYEVSQSRIGSTLWENQELYIKNSPVFYADKVNTPLLIMHNDNDGAVPWNQGVEYFLALKRLNKPVWMLTYNNEEHNLTKRPNCMDLSIRMSQFFDHYLKDKPAPEWMVKGVPALMKEKNNAYQLVED